MAPENSLAGLREALRYPIDGVEFDLHSTKDEVLVLHHDEHVMTDSGQLVAISRLEYADLKKLYARRRTTLVTLTEAYRLIRKLSPGSEIVLDCKQTGWAKPLAKFLKSEIKKQNEWQKVIILSFWLKPLIEFKNICDQSRCYYLYRRLPFLHLPVSKLHRFEGVGFNYKWVYAPILWSCHWLGLKTYYYTVNDLRYAKRYKKLDLNYLATDRPDLINHKTLEDIKS